MARRPLNLAGKKNRFRTLTIENLEVRQLLSANTISGVGQAPVGKAGPDLPAPIVYDANSHKLTFTGDNGANVASVTVDTKGTGTIADDQIVASITIGTQTTTLRVNRVTNPTTLAAAVTDIVFNGYGGNDTFTNKTAINCEAHGGDGDDTLIGGYGYNYLYGDAGNDTLTGSDFGNRIEGGAGNDTITSGAMADTIFGGDGDDTIDAGNGNNYVDGGIGKDSIKCGIGDDSIVGGDGDDAIDAGAGNDLVYGGNGNDFILGNAGNDTLYGEAGNDTIDGGVGADIVRGGAGNDTLYGQKGNFYGRGADENYLGEGDKVYGDDGDDILYVGMNDYADGGAGNNITNVAVHTLHHHG
jgi:Ca2+-binding RTX toxin-like protein